MGHLLFYLNCFQFKFNFRLNLEGDIMINFNSTTNRLKDLNDKYEYNKMKMETFTTNSTSYRQLYEENEKIVNELKETISF